MFTSDVAESFQKEIEIISVDGEVLCDVIDYMYTGDISIGVNNVQSVFSAANFLELLPLCDRCANFMASQINVQNCVELYQFSKFHNNEALRSKCFTYVCDNIKRVCLGDSFLILGYEDFSDFIRSDNLNVDKEEIVFNIVICWLRHRANNFGEALTEEEATKLFQMIRMSFLSTRYLTDVVKDNQFVLENHYCARVIPVVKLWTISKNVVEDNDVDQLLVDFNLNTQPRFGMFAREMLVFCGGSQDRDNRSLTAFDPFTRENYYSIKPHVSFDYTFRVDFHSAVVTEENVIYVIGGIFYSDHHFETAGPALNCVKSYNQLEKKWIDKPPLITARCAHTTVFVNGMIFAIGGKEFYPGGNALSSVEYFDVDDSSWSPAAPMPHGLYHHSCVVQRECIFVLGGYDDSGAVLDTIFKYDVKEDVWVVYNQSLPSARAEFGSTICDDKLYVCGGMGNNRKLSSFDVYNFDSETWEKGPDFPEERKASVLVNIDDNVYLCGGERTIHSRLNRPPRHSQTKDLWKFEPFSQIWIREVKLVQFPNPYGCVKATLNIKRMTVSDYISTETTET